MRFYFLHPFVHNIEEAVAYMMVPVPENVVWDNDNPELLFVSEWIYYKKKYFKEFKRLWAKAKVRVFYAGEAVEPDFNLFDYAVGFDNHLEFDGRFIRLPSPLDFFEDFLPKKNNDVQNIEEAKQLLTEKQGFCSFLYSNPNAHPMRDQLFYGISKYKRVDSLGKHLNNVEKQGTGYVGHAAEGIDIKSLYKFSIASENATYDGYTSEKVFTSLSAHTVPIYWGNKDIKEDINPKAFINVRDFNSFDELTEHIAYIDSHDDEWGKMISEPWMTPAQEAYHKQRTKHYQEQMAYLLNGSIEGKDRLAYGTHQELYRKNYFFEVFPLQLNRYNYRTYIQKLIKKVRR